ncbi:MAG: NAD(P)-dependent alcohol dehydrogenase [Proteobacteria bacterium]|nr:NAD(P)-dependent alcohol dehydrogenase [Pseudomonadota bacterium]
MKACIYEEYGPAEVVTVGEVPTPAPRANEILVQVHAAAVTTADWRFRASSFPGGFWLAGRLLLGLLRPRHPILGMDYAGVVAEVGRDVERFRVGDAVFGATSRGAHAEFVAVKASGAIALKPASWSYEEAAAIPFGGNSALMFMRDFGKVKAGQRVLVIGASGGVGSWAVQIARHLGAEVTGACSTRNVELVRALGAHHVVDYTAGSPFGEGTYDLVFDTVGVTTFAGAKPALTAKGTYLPLEGSLGTMAQAVFTAFGAGKKVKHAISKNTRRDLEELAALIEAGVLRPIVDTAVPMARIADAYRLVESRHKRGSVIVTMHAPRPSAMAAPSQPARR